MINSFDIIACLDFVKTLMIPVGWIISMLLGFLAAILLDRRRTLGGICARIEMIKDEISDASELELRDVHLPNSIESVWAAAIPKLKEAIFGAVPFVLFSRSREELLADWAAIKRFDLRNYYDRGTDAVVDRLFGHSVTTKKEGLLAALGEIEKHVR